jgi:hypothetical protein
MPRKALKRLFVVGAGAVTAATITTPATAVIFGPPPPAFLHYKPCAFEDSPGPCYWNAPQRGDRGGLSFWVDPAQNVHYYRP